MPRLANTVTNQGRLLPARAQKPYTKRRAGWWRAQAGPGRVCVRSLCVDAVDCESAAEDEVAGPDRECYALKTESVEPCPESP